MLDVLIYICGAFVVIGGLWLGYLGAFGHLKGHQVLGLWVLYGTFFFVLTGAFLYFHQNLRKTSTATPLDTANRPYMWTKEFNFGGLVIGEHPRFQVVLENAGKIPALNFRGQIVGYTTPPPLSEPLQFPASPYESSVFIPAGGSVNQVFVDKDFVSNEAFIQTVNSEQAVMYVYGRAEYDDSNGKHYTLTYCAFWNPSKKSFTACPKYNETT